LFKKLKECDENHVVFVSQTHDKKSNPLSYEMKVWFLKRTFPDINFSDDLSIRTLFDALEIFDREGFERVIMVVGQDRVTEVRNIVQPYLNNPSKTPNFKFQFLTISAGNRDPKSRGLIKGISASKMRQFAIDMDWWKFRVGCPVSMTDIDAYAMMLGVREGLGLK
jgi:hypothetical protein